MLGIRNDHSSTVKKQPMFANKNQNAKSANQIRRSISSSAQQPILKVGSFFVCLKQVMWNRVRTGLKST